MRHCGLVGVLLACAALVGGCHGHGGGGGGGGGWPGGVLPAGAAGPVVGLGPQVLQEDLVPIVPSQCNIAVQFGGTFFISQAGTPVPAMAFADNVKAMAALNTIKFYNATKVGYINRPNPVMMYLLVNNQSPVGPAPGESSVQFNWQNVTVQQAGANWQVTEPTAGALLTFPDQNSANMARMVIQKYQFTRKCAAGGAGPPSAVTPMMYFRK